MLSLKCLTALALAFILETNGGLAADATMPAGDAAKPMAPMMPGLTVGDRAPAFTLVNATGQEVTLAALLKKGKVALVFYRSGDWCPFCIAQLKDLQAHLAAIEGSGVQLVGISYDPPATLARSAAKFGLTFPLLSDDGSKVIDAFGIRNHEATGKAVGVPHPAIFILDQTGTIRAKLMHEGYRDRPTPADIIAAVRTLS